MQYQEPELIYPGKLLKDNFLYYIKRIHWFLISCIIFSFFAYKKVQKMKPTYKVNASILIKDDSNGNMFNESSAFSDLGYNMMYYPLDNEIAILKSRALIQKVVSDLKLNISYFKKKGNNWVDNYENQAFKLTFLNGESDLFNKESSILIKPLSDRYFEWIENEELNKSAFGDPIKTQIGEIVITPNNFKINNEYLIQIDKLENTISSYANSITIEKVNEYSNVLLISFEHENEFKALDVINNLIKQHQQDAIEDKNQVSLNSVKFINERISLITKELGNVEGIVQNYKTQNEVFDVITEKDLFLENKSENDHQILENEMQLKLLEYVKTYIQEERGASSLMPSNVGLQDHLIENDIQIHNNLVLERNRILKTSSEKNPVAQNLEAKIYSLRENLSESLTKLENTFKVKQKQLKSQNLSLESRINTLPKQEKELREIQRQQQIKEQLYLYLLQKREETAITLALTVPNSKIIDKAYCDGATFSPPKRTLFSIYMLIGLIVPFVLLFIRKKINLKINNVHSLDKFKTPVLTEIPKISSSQSINIDENPFLLESFRFLRTNISFYNQKEEKPIIIVTSTLPFEGKSFVSIHLAKSYSLSSKKVLLISLDLRKPSLETKLNITKGKGVTNYLSEEIKLQDLVIHKNDDFPFDLLSSGDLHSNPAELLLKVKINQLFEEAKKIYDIIIVDSAPIGIVADTFSISSFATLTLYVVRHQYVDYHLLNRVINDAKDKKLNNLFFVYNFSPKNATFEYRYEQYYGNQKTSRLHQFIQWFRW
ncbi:MAG: AAA family ATPase [Flavobacteriia bacterium]|nr:AAA family ATPase [Flavobacteriia bacterium]